MSQFRLSTPSTYATNRNTFSQLSNTSTNTSNKMSTTTNTSTSPSKLYGKQSPSRPSSGPTTTPNTASLANLSPPLLHSLRESFSLLDKDSDGTISPPDLLAMLISLGDIDPSHPHSTSTSLSNNPLLNSYFSLVPTPFNLPSYLTHLSTHLSLVSSEDELMTAFSAFDDTDSGMVDLNELKAAILGNEGYNIDDEEQGRLTLEEMERGVRGFTRRKGLGQSREGERFNYREWIGSVLGKGEGGEED